MNDDLVKLKIFNHIPAVPERNLILLRMGYHKKTTVLKEKDERFLDAGIRLGLSLCNNRGVYARLKIIGRGEDYVEIEGHHRFKSKDLAKRLTKSEELILMAATVGSDVTAKINDEITRGSAALAVVLDAVASEAADALLDWVERFLRKKLRREGLQLIKHRYSPGYGDLPLENQKTIYDILKLEKLDVRLTERFLLIPEKSVMAMIGAERIGLNE